MPQPAEHAVGPVVGRSRQTRLVQKPAEQGRVTLFFLDEQPHGGDVVRIVALAAVASGAPQDVRPLSALADLEDRDGPADGAALVVGNGFLDGVTLNTDLTVSNLGSLNVVNGLTLNGVLTVQNAGNSTQLVFAGAQTLNGTGQVVLAGTSTTSYIGLGSGGPATLTIAPGIKRGSNRRKRGEDVKQGDRILPAGRRLKPQDIGLAASIGLAALPVRTRLAVAIFSTGDEIREPGTSAPPGAVYDANRFALRAALESLGCRVTDLGIVVDRFAAVHDALARASAAHDLILTSGGMSTGEEDHVKAAVEALGSLHFWRLAIKPGRPIAFGQVNRVPFVGLPGNPVAVMVTFLRVARPLILRLAGAAISSRS